MALSTVCEGEGLTWRRLRDAHIGQPYDPQGALDQRSFEMMEKVPANKLFHALKY